MVLKLASDLILWSKNAALKQIFREKTYSRLSNHEQRPEYPTIVEEKKIYCTKKKSKYRNTMLVTLL